MTNFFRIFKYGWIGFWRNIWISTATIGVMALALSVVSSLFIIGNITDTFVKDLQGKIDISVYFKQDAEEANILKLQYQLEAREEVKEVEYVSRDGALATFKERHKGNELLMASLAELNSNPFQASLNIKANSASQFDAIASFIGSFEAQDIIGKINYKENEKVIQKLTAITSSIEKIGLFFTFLLSSIVILITFNTIRLVIYSYRDEISVMKLVGASDWFIRGPFIVTGAMYGIISAFLTWIVFFFSLWLISEKVGSVFPGSDIFAYWTSSFFGIFLMLIAFGVGLGSVSSFIAIRRYLKI